jgi:hypothetical protein
MSKTGAYTNTHKSKRHGPVLTADVLGLKYGQSTESKLVELWKRVCVASQGCVSGSNDDLHLAQRSRHLSAAQLWQRLPNTTLWVCLCDMCAHLAAVASFLPQARAGGAACEAA